MLLYSWADVMGYENFLDGIEDPVLRAETRGQDRGDVPPRGPRRLPPPGDSSRYFDEAIDALRRLVRRLPRDGDRGRGGAGRRAAAAKSRRATGTIVNPELFERLRAVRRRLADAEGVPAYIVFSDAVLREMAKHAPRSRAELLAVSGVGPVKLERYGEAFLEELRQG